MIDVIDEAYKEFLELMSDVEGRGNAKSLSSVGATYVTVFVNYLKGKIEDGDKEASKCDSGACDISKGGK